MTSRQDPTPFTDTNLMREAVRAAFPVALREQPPGEQATWIREQGFHNLAGRVWLHVSNLPGTTRDQALVATQRATAMLLLLTNPVTEELHERAGQRAADTVELLTRFSASAALTEWGLFAPSDLSELMAHR